jgi:hypothetical protein
MLGDIRNPRLSLSEIFVLVSKIDSKEILCNKGAEGITVA